MEFEELMATARELGSHVDTDWAEDNATMYDEFESRVNSAWENGFITDMQFDTLVITAFYDYPDLKCDY